MDRKKRKILKGIVEKKSGDKTISVKISHKKQDNVYKKVVTTHEKMLVHDENNECKLGDKVEIMETRPLSKNKKWRFANFIDKVKNEEKPKKTKKQK